MHRLISCRIDHRAAISPGVWAGAIISVDGARGDAAAADVIPAPSPRVSSPGVTDGSTCGKGDLQKVGVGKGSGVVWIGRVILKSPKRVVGEDHALEHGEALAQVEKMRGVKATKEIRAHIYAGKADNQRQRAAVGRGQAPGIGKGHRLKGIVKHRTRIQAGGAGGRRVGSGRSRTGRGR